jgi:probable rRNA maturation factor
MNMKKEKKIKINYITYIKNHYIPTTVNMKKWILKSLLAELPSQVNIIFAGKKRIRTLNNKYLNNDYPTNVLTFPNNDSELLSGDIVLCPEIINYESKKYELSTNLRWAHMIVHSMLHLQGYDHKIKKDRLCMENIEVKILYDMNYDNPYERI